MVPQRGLVTARRRPPPVSEAVSWPRRDRTGPLAPGARELVTWRQRTQELGVSDRDWWDPAFAWATRLELRSGQFVPGLPTVSSDGSRPGKRQGRRCAEGPSTLAMDEERESSKGAEEAAD